MSVGLGSKEMWVEGVGEIYLDQFANYRYDTDRPNQAFFGSGEHYNYITYTSKKGVKREALFLFANSKAQKDYSRALIRWVDQDGLIKMVDISKITNYQTVKVLKILKAEMLV